MVAVGGSCAWAGLDRTGTSAVPRARIEATRRPNANFRDSFTFSRPFKVSSTNCPVVRDGRGPRTCSHPSSSGSRHCLSHPPTLSEEPLYPGQVGWLSDGGTGKPWSNDVPHIGRELRVYAARESALLNWGNTSLSVSGRSAAFTEPGAGHRRRVSRRLSCVPPWRSACTGPVISPEYRFICPST